MFDDDNSGGNYSSQEDVLSEAESLQSKKREARVDKRASGEAHTTIITNNHSYTLMGTLDQNEMNELRQSCDVHGEPGKVVLGQGNFGKVRVAKSEAGFVAIKKIKNPPISTLNEERLYDLLRSKNVPNVMIPIDSVETINHSDEDVLYQFMPLADFGDANKLRIGLSAATLTAEERLSLNHHFIKVISNTFSSLHNNDVCHLDFKPANLLFDSKGNMYVSDFGSALSQVNERKSFMITSSDMGYWSPEIILNRGNFNSSNDLFKLESWRMGLTLLEITYPEIDTKSLKMLLSEAAKNCKDPSAVSPESFTSSLNEILMKMKNDLDKNNVPDDIQKIVLGLLNPDPTKRMNVAEAQTIAAKFQPTQHQEAFNKIQAQREFIEFVQKIEKCKSVNESIEKNGPDRITSKQEDEKIQLSKFEKYLPILQNKDLTREEKLTQLKDEFNKNYQSKNANSMESAQEISPTRENQHPLNPN